MLTYVNFFFLLKKYHIDILKKEKNSVGSTDKFCAAVWYELVQRQEARVFNFWIPLTEIYNCIYYIHNQWLIETFE